MTEQGRIRTGRSILIDTCPECGVYIGFRAAIVRGRLLIHPEYPDPNARIANNGVCCSKCDCLIAPMHMIRGVIPTKSPNDGEIDT